MRHLEVAAQQSKKVTREEAVANAKATAEQLGKHLPMSLDNGVTVVRYAPHSPCGLLRLSFCKCIQKCMGCMLRRVRKLCQCLSNHMLE